MRSNTTESYRKKYIAPRLPSLKPDRGTLFILTLPFIVVIGGMIWMQIFADVPLNGKGLPNQTDDFFPLFTCSRILRPGFVACGVTSFTLEFFLFSFLLYINPFTLMTLATLYIIKTAYQTRNKT